MTDLKIYPRNSKEEIELGKTFSPKFDELGLIPCIVTDSKSKEVLMFAWMNQDALSETVQTGKVVFYSRSRKKIWKKGESSGRELNVEKLLVDCDQDVLQVQVTAEQEGTCHQGYRSCFYRELKNANGELEFVIKNRSFDPDEVY